MVREVTTRGRPMLLDEILADIFDPATARELVTQTLDLNPGLAALGPAIPSGTRVLIPDAPPARAEPKAIVDLYG